MGIHPLWKIEEKLFSQGIKIIGGIDEAGRGPLAGPVVAACVLVNNNYDLESSVYYTILKDVNDSKKIAAKRRKEIFKALKNEFAFAVGACDSETIDQMNIFAASYLAMKKAVTALKIKPEIILVDGKFEIPNFSLPQQAIIKGDAKSFAIAAASIIAKETRDEIMDGWHKKYPLYGFNKHRGYGTKQHLASIGQHGPCPIHRKSFSPFKPAC